MRMGWDLATAGYAGSGVIHNGIAFSAVRLIAGSVEALG